MFKINLVPEVQEKKLQVKKINTYSTLFGIALLAIGGVALLLISGIDIAKKAAIVSNKKKIEAVKVESEKYKELEKTVLSLENGLAGIKQIADGTNSWTKLLPHLEKATPGDIKYVSLKVAAGTVEGSLEGASVDSLAKYIESYKNYQVVVLSGPGIEGDTANISLDGGENVSVNVKSSGRWIYALNFDPAVSHEIKVETKKTGDEVAVDSNEVITTQIKYAADTKKIESTDPSVTAEVKYLFSEVESKQYQKKDNGVAFDVTFKFDEKSIW